MNSSTDSQPADPEQPHLDSIVPYRAMGSSSDRSTTSSIVFLTVLSLCLMALAPVPELLHVLGIVTSIDEKHIDVKTAKGQVVSVLLTKQVKYKNKNNPKSLDPPTVGDRVIIEASRDEKNKKVTATVVHYSPGSSLPPPR
ncbi:MAG: hypothetical protein KF747_05200 [Nitrospira sp.]|uniref:hypothetical protein n=1 Tax=Nitrospira sp. BLG_1 TaxID=3395883 RepID=UPI0039BD5567|nr:hypothetical protein [Nitrospira sp.]